MTVQGSSATRQNKADRVLARLTVSVIFLALLLAFPASGLAAKTPEKGETLPSFTLPAPEDGTDLKYLGLKGPDFQLKDIDYQVLIVEIIGVYCPQCYRQAPLFNKLFSRLDRKGIGDRVKMLAIAAGGTATEIKFLREKGTYSFPVVKDESFDVHKLIGEPRTPFIMVLNREGEVLYTHLGVIEDVDTFYQQIQDLVKQ